MGPLAPKVIWRPSCIPAAELPASACKSRSCGANVFIVGMTANAPLVPLAKISFEPPGPGTNSRASSSPPPDRSSTAPGFTSMRLPGASRLTVFSTGEVTDVPAYVQAPLPTVEPNGTVRPLPETDVTLPALNSMLCVAFRSMLPNGARRTPFCKISAALIAMDPPADRGAAEVASPAPIVTRLPGALIANDEPDVGAI